MKGVNTLRDYLSHSYVRQSLFFNHKIKTKKVNLSFFSLKLQIGNAPTVNSSLNTKRGKRYCPRHGCRRRIPSSPTPARERTSRVRTLRRSRLSGWSHRCAQPFRISPPLGCRATLSFNKDFKNPFTRLPVAVGIAGLRQGAVLSFIVQQHGDFLYNQIAVGADQLYRAGIDRLGTLGGVAHHRCTLFHQMFLSPPWVSDTASSPKISRMGLRTLGLRCMG